MVLIVIERRGRVADYLNELPLPVVFEERTVGEESDRLSHAGYSNG
jgi:hypothetical protein